MDQLLFLARTAVARAWLESPDTRNDPVRRALLSTIDGHRNVIELESVARAMGLDAAALDDLRQQGLIELTAATAADPVLGH
jgi:hypothetical protein